MNQIGGIAIIGSRLVRVPARFTVLALAFFALFAFFAAIPVPSPSADVFSSHLFCAFCAFSRLFSAYLSALGLKPPAESFVPLGHLRESAFVLPRRISGLRLLYPSFASIRVDSRFALEFLLQLKIEEATNRICGLRIIPRDGVGKRRWRIKEVIDPESNLAAR